MKSVTVKTYKQNKHGVPSPDVGEVKFRGTLVNTRSIGVGKYQNQRQGSLVIHSTYRTANGTEVLVEEAYEPFSNGRLVERNLFVDNTRVAFLNGKPCNPKLLAAIG